MNTAVSDLTALPVKSRVEMGNRKTADQEVLALARDIIADIEMSKSTFQSLVLRSLRIARLLSDDKMIELFTYESRGYPADDPKAMALLELTNRQGNKTEDGKSYYHPQGAGELETVIAGYYHQIEALKAFKPSGDWATTQLSNQVKQIRDLSSYAGVKVKIKETVTGIMYDYCCQSLNKVSFVSQSDDIFNKFREEVEDKSRDLDEIYRKWPHVFERLETGDSEAISHALSSCRRIIDRFAEHLLGDVDGEIEVSGAKIDCSRGKTRNRIRAYVAQRAASTSVCERLSKNMTTLYDRVSVGVHHDVSRREARALVLNTYLIFGEILGLGEK